jgi:hypothetical protein
MADALKDVRDAGFPFFSLVPWILDPRGMRRASVAPCLVGNGSVSPRT